MKHPAGYSKIYSKSQTFRVTLNIFCINMDISVCRYNYAPAYLSTVCNQMGLNDLRIFRPAKNIFQVQTAMWFHGSTLYGPLDHKNLFLGVSLVQLDMLKWAEREIHGIAVIFTQYSGGASVFWVAIASAITRYLVHSQSLHVLPCELRICFHRTDIRREYWEWCIFLLKIIRW